MRMITTLGYIKKFLKKKKKKLYNKTLEQKVNKKEIKMIDLSSLES